MTARTQVTSLLAAAAIIGACSSDDTVPFGNSAASSTGGSACVPGDSKACSCVDGSRGAQVCAGDGSGFEACVCQGGAGGDGGNGAAGGNGGSAGGSVCAPGSTMPCYSGPAGTAGVGLCVAGTQTCAADGSGFGGCMGEVAPVAETCSTPGDDDCDGTPNEKGPDCACAPGSQAACYSGPPATENVGPCHGGMQQCNATGTGYGPCVGEVTPVAETCNTPVDDDCDAFVNEEGAGCVCAPSSTGPCYDGPQGTENVGPCKGGMHTCNAQGTAWGACMGQVVPQTDLCATVTDEDCNGSPMPCVPSATWSKDIGTNGSEPPMSLAVDGAGNSAVASEYAYLAKVDAGGNPLWTKQLAANVRAIAFKANGNLVVTGLLQGIADFGGGALAAQGNADVFIVELDAGGNHVWSKRYGGPLAEVPFGLAIDGAGAIIVTGQAQQGADFGGGPLSTAGSDYFIAKLDPTGNHIWSKALGGPGEDQFAFVAVDGAGAIVLTGWATGPVDFGGGLLMANNNGYFDVFIAKLAPDGSHLWSDVFGDPKDQYIAPPSVDAAGDVIVTGQFYGSVDFGGGALVAGDPPNADVFVAKFSSNGAHLWSKDFGDGSYQGGQGVTADPGGNVFFTGSYQGNPDFGGGPLSWVGSDDNYVVKLDPAGNHIWSAGFGDGSYQLGRAVRVDSAGYVLQLGANSGTVDFGHGPLTTNGDVDMTLAKLAP